MKETDSGEEIGKSMSKKDGTSPKIQKQPQTSEKVVKLKTDPKLSYNMGTLQRFTDFVFHDLQEGEEILTWTPKNKPSYPTELADTVKKLTRATRPLATYFGTATCTRDADGHLYNRKSLFSALHVVVLDDIGTKIPLDKLPEELAPNYIIETSEGNFQYGFVLAEPIRDLALAEALIHLVYTSGVSDEGGKMATKLVRLPLGVNGKKGDKRLFEMKLEELGGEYWTPKELLDVLDVGVTWDDVLEDVSAARGGDSATKVGTSLWSPVKAVAPSLSGIVDPILEWLYEEDLVYTDNGKWVTVECPWGYEHSDGNTTAGYTPVGRGEGEELKRRGFHCFHDSCKDNHTAEYLSALAAQGAPEVSIVDQAAELVANYALVTTEDAVYRLRGVRNPTSMKIGAFRNAYPRSVNVYDGQGKAVKVKEHSLWLTAPNRLTLTSRLYDPTSKERVIEHDGQQHLNTFTHPQWGNGLVDKHDLDKFLEFIDYLIPIKVEREYFMEWLAAKAQDVTFKGAAMLMVAPVQGTGRTTLTDMLTQLFTPANVKKVNFDTLLSGTRQGSFNDWQESILVTCDEVMGSDTNKYAAYESLKDLFDPKPKQTMINSKHVGLRHAVLYTSYILLTNHTNAIGALGDDRRVYAITNTTIPETPKYFAELNDWLAEKDENGDPKWCKSVWRYLQDQPVDLVKLHAPVEMTEAKEVMVEETTNVYDNIAKVITDKMGDITCIPLARECMSDIFGSVGLEDDPSKVELVCRLMQKHSRGIPKTVMTKAAVVKINGKACRIRLNSHYMKVNGIETISNMTSNELETLRLTSYDILRDISDNKLKFIDSVVAELDF